MDPLLIPNFQFQIPNVHIFWARAIQLVMARKPPCLFLKRLLAVCFLTEPVTGAMAAERSVHSAGITEVHQVPINVIHRPIPPVLEEEKVKSLMKTIEVR